MIHQGYALGNAAKWSFPAYANGRLYARDARQLVCVDLAKGK